MSRTLLSLALVLAVCRVTSAVEQPADIDEHSTHEQSRTIEIAQSAQDEMRINAFCLSPNGEIIAACGNGPGEIRVLNDEGELLRSWKLDVKPEAINTTADGTILAGGEGKLFHFAADGKILNQAEAPHAESLRENTETLRKEAIAYLERSMSQNRDPVASLKSRISTYERIIAQIEKKRETEKLNEQEEALLKALPKTLTAWQEQLADEEEKIAEAARLNGDDAKEEKPSGPSEEAIAAQVKRMMDSKMRIASISTDGESIFVATRAMTGYGFAVWKLNQSLAEGEEIVTGLSGCCGQMDVQACKNGLYVAENSRKRVVCYDANGEEVRKWGKADRTGVDGFTSCCNPMNVCFNKNGDVFTAESNTGRIKRFSAEGEFLNFVGDVKLVPGCKNVSIAVTPDSSRVYMLDITRNHIVVMDAKPEAAQPETGAKPEPKAAQDEDEEAKPASVFSFF